MNLPVLESERLRFRPFGENDFASLTLLDTDPEVVRYLGAGKVRSETETQQTLKRILGHYAQKGFGLYATEIKASGEFAGRTGLIPWTLDGEAVWEVGYTLRPKFWGQGYATESAQFWKRYGFQILPDSFLVSLIHPLNDKSIHVAKKNGMHLWKETTLSGNAVKVFRVDRTEP